MNENTDVDDAQVIDALTELQVVIRKSKKGRILSVDFSNVASKTDDQIVEKLSGLPRLKHVILPESRISNQVIPILTSLQHLDTLDLENTDISDQYADLFLNCQKLALLSITGTSISKEKVAELRKKMIGTRIVYRS